MQTIAAGRRSKRLMPQPVRTLAQNFQPSLWRLLVHSVPPSFATFSKPFRLPSTPRRHLSLVVSVNES